jgi:hypothetical protein
MSTNDLNFSQQEKLFDPKLSRPVTLIGAGSVGSLVANMLVRIGVHDLTVFDDDSVDSHNVGPSLYGKGDIGYYKVDRLRAIIERDTGVRIKTVLKRYEGESLRGSVICCVDTMEARQMIWGAIKKKLFVDILIDTRTSEHFFQVFAVRPCNHRDIAHYEPFLAYSSDEASPAMCGLHSIITVASRTAAVAVGALSDFWTSDRTEFVQWDQGGSNVFIHPKQEN